MADSLSDLSIQPPADPEAQAAVTDFLDYTEFFPSDLYRSLSLIGKLDQSYQDDAAAIHGLATTYSKLPTLPRSERPNAQSLRKDISTTLDHALRCREATFAEASRLCVVADNLHGRLVNIKAKLEAMPTPPSRDPTPAPASAPKDRSPHANRTRRSDADRTPRLKLFVDTDKANGTMKTQRQKNRVRRIVVPGEIMPPFDPNSPGASIESESEMELELSPVKRPNTAGSDGTQRRKNGSVKVPKLKLGPKLPKTPRVPSGMGTNVHSQVAGISVSNAMRSLTPPPENPQPGSEWAPWLKLTDYELHMIRKKMKKNANWGPSGNMIRDRLIERGRGMAAMLKAQQKAEAEGSMFLDEEPHKSTKREQLMAMSDALTTGKKPTGSADMLGGPPIIHTPTADDFDAESDDGLDDNEKRMKRERKQMNQLTEKIKEYGATVDRMLPHPMLISPSVNSAVSPTESVSKKTSKKRKRTEPESSAEATSASYADAERAASEVATTNSEYFVDAGESKTADDQIDPALINGDENAVEGADVNMVDADIAIDPAFTADDKKPDSVLEDDDAAEEPPAKKLKLVGATSKKGKATKVPLADADADEETPAIEAAEAGPRRRTSARPSTSAGESKISIRLSAKDAATIAEAEAESASTQRRSTRKTLSTATEDAAPSSTTRQRKTASSSLEPVGALTLTTTTAEHLPSRRSSRANNATARPSTANDATGRRASGTKLRLSTGGRGTKRSPRASDPGPGFATELSADVDPDEPRYCVCNDVSFGEMVGCEYTNCEKEWFHLGCVGLTKAPHKREKWYCPICREDLGVDVHGKPVPTAAEEEEDGHVEEVEEAPVEPFANSLNVVTRRSSRGKQ